MIKQINFQYQNTITKFVRTSQEWHKYFAPKPPKAGTVLLYSTNRAVPIGQLKEKNKLTESELLLKPNSDENEAEHIRKEMNNTGM